MEMLVKNSLEKIKFRGPDQSKIIFDEIDNFYICIGFNRLSILDLSDDSMQPILTKNQISVFNGEIYNYNQIRNINYASDTLFLKDFLEKKSIKDLLENIKGMFSIATLNKIDKKFYLISDLFGQKPTFYNNTEDFLIFSSQMSSLLELKITNNQINIDALENYKKYNFIFGEKTIFTDIFYLEPNKIVEFNISKSGINKKSYKRPKVNLNNQNLIINNENNFEDVFLKNIQLHMNADVKTCSLLSSGIDSTLISLFANKLNNAHETFTLNFNEKKISEIKDINNLKKKYKIKNTIIEPQKNDIFDFIENIPDIFDQPFSDSSQINQYIIYKNIKKLGYKCVLTGDGGDEIFGGYNRYTNFNLINYIKKINFLNKDIYKHILNKLSKKNIYQIDKIHKFIKILNTKEVDDYYFSLLSNDYEYDHKIILENLELENDKSTILKLDRIFYLPYDILTKIDRTSMYNSIESRSPFIYDDLVNFADKNSLAKTHKRKEVLHNLLYKSFKIRIKNQKKGFAFSIENYLLRNNNFYSFINDILSYGQKNYLDILGGNNFNIIINEFRKGVNIYNFIIWNRIVLIIWLKKYA